MKSTYLWMNGELRKTEDAMVHFLTPAMHYGIAVFEGIRSYATERGPAIFRLTDHIERLVRSAAILGWKALPFTQAQIIEACRVVVSENGFTSCYLRPLIYQGVGGWNLNIDTGTPHIGIAAWEWNKYLGEGALEKGIRANVSSYTRHHPNVMMTKAKLAGNYPNSVLAKTESVRLGFDEAIMLDTDGLVAECTGANLFLVRKGQLVTPPAAQVLEGITRESVMTLAKDLGHTVVERVVSRDELYLADEVFVTGTAAEVIGIREIDFRPVGAGGTGPITRALQEAYTASVLGRHPRSEAWLTYAKGP